MFRTAPVLLILLSLMAPAWAQSVFLPAPEASPVERQVRDPSTGFILPPDQQNAPAPAVNWDPPPDPDKNMPFMRGLRDQQGDFSGRIREVCGARSFRVEVERAAFTNAFTAQQQLPIHLGSLVTSMRNICLDLRSRTIIDQLFSSITIIHDPAHKQRPEVIGRGYGITMRYDFSQPRPVDPKILTPELMGAMSQLVREYDIRRTQLDAKPRTVE